MKESKKRENSSSKKKKHNRNVINLDSWDQTDLEDADEKVLERRLHQLKLQLQMAQDEASHESRQSSSKHKKKHEVLSSEVDSTDSGSTISSATSSSVNKYKSRKSSSFSGDDRKKYQRSSLPKKKISKEIKAARSSTRSERENNCDSKADKKFVIRRKVSPMLDKSASRARTRKSPSLDKRDLYNRLDTGRWHDKAKEFEKERTKLHEDDHDRIRSRSRIERNRSTSTQREQRVMSRSKNERKKLVGRTVPSTAARRKDSPEPVRPRTAAYDSGARRITVVTRKVSPRDERFGRHDERRIDLKVTRRNDVRSGDLRDLSVRVTRDIRERKEPVPKICEKPREREILKSHREIVDHSRMDRDRNKVNEDRFKDRDKRQHDRLEPERNVRNVRNDNRDLVDDKFRRNDRIVEPVRVGNNRHIANESVFDRIRNRYNDRRNAENQRLGRDRVADIRKDRPVEKEIVKSRNLEPSMLIRERRTNIPVPIRARSLHRDRKEPERTTAERRTPVDFDKKFTSPLNARKVRETDNRANMKRKSLESDDPTWAKKKGINKVRSRSRSSEKRKRRRSSQEEWRVIDMTSPVLDDEFSEENKCNSETNVQNKVKRSVTNKLKSKVKNEEIDENEKNKQNKTILTDELSDISDEDFNDVNSNSIVKNKKELVTKNDRILENDKNNRKLDQKIIRERNDFEFDKSSPPDSKSANTDVDDLINHQKMTSETNERVDLEKIDNLDSEEETVSRVSDALNVDWADLVEESKKKISSLDNDTSNARRRWDAMNIFARIGISEKYAGEDLFNKIQKDVAAANSMSENLNQDAAVIEESRQKILHPVPALHVCMKNRAIRRQTLFEPYRSAISARKDIAIRRTLCGLPVKSTPSQQMIGICHWIV